jgi:hypothetical protein
LGGPAAHSEKERERAGTPSSHFVEAQAEQELWQELHDHGASLNRAMNEALRIPDPSSDFVVSSLAFFCVRAFPDPFSSRLARRRRNLERRARERYEPSTASTST